jgi:hypothetical protein
MQELLMRRLLIAAAAFVAVAGALSGCATPTPYQPAPATGGRYAFGFADQQIDASHWRVSFAGNSLTSRETVEKYLLYRAAELTVQQGGDWFATDQRKTERHSSFVGTGDPFYDEFGWGWSPYWNFYGPRGWAPWSPWGPDPFMDVQQVDRYEAHAEIVIGHGAQPQGMRVYNAREVMQHLGPSIVMPAPRK